MTTATDAITESRQHDTIVHLTASDETEASALISELMAVADDDESTDWTDAGPGLYEVWGYDPDDDSDATTWRVHITVESVE